MNKRTLTGFTVAALMLGASAAQAEVDLERGEELNNEVCAACHGASGISETPEWPSHAGQHSDYIVHQMELFRDENRWDPQALMTENAVDLSDEEIRDVAAWLESQTPPGPQEVDEELAEQGEKIYHAGIPEENVASCASCHGPNGEGVKGAQFAAVAGQQEAYLRQSLEGFKSEERQSDRNRMMRDTADKLSDEQIEALAAYMASMEHSEAE
ncbi:MAG: c-type cytochrome [Halorhodospira sp.]